jgi:hypothetical protein
VTPHEVAARFDQLAQQEKWFEIQDELLPIMSGSVEPPTAKNLKNAEGKAAVRKKAEELIKQVETVHSSSTTAPVVAVIILRWDGAWRLPVKGLGRIKMDEIMLYEVKDGQIGLEQFFY